ncbi:MAG: SLC13 family permease [Candidatus Neomarinimicrobiota bacterium]
MTSPTRRTIALVSGPLFFLLFILFFDLDPSNRQVTYMGAIALWMAIWWITETVPLAVTALLPVILFPAMGVMNGRDVSSIYFNHIIFLFIGGFLVALAMERWNLHKRIALRIMMIFGVHPAGILLGFMTATWFLSMWISNTATTMMMVPIGLAVITRLEKLLGKNQVQKYSIGLFLGLAYSASIGGIATPVGTPPNLSFTRIFSIIFPEAPEISFASWFVFAFPLSLIFLVLLWLILTKFFCGGINRSRLDATVFRKQLKELGRISFEERTVLFDFLLLIFLWLFRSDISVGSFVIPGWSRLFPDPAFLNDGTVAIAMATILFLVPSRKHPGSRIMNWETASKLPWNIVLLFGGGFALASGFTKSGLSDWLGDQLSGIGSLHPVLIVGMVCLFVTFLTELTSNTATSEMLLPILAALAISIKVNPLLLMIPATLSCSCAFMLPVATPPNAIIFGTQRVRVSEMAKVGLLINMVGVILITFFAFTFLRGILGIDFSTLPLWAQ